MTYIRATPKQVFDAITDPDVARRYWAHENVSEWTAGSRREHVRSDVDRKVMLAGRVLENDRPKRPVMTRAGVSDMNDPARPSRISFELESFPDVVRPTVSHEELHEDGEMARAIGEGWPRVLSSLKSFLETGEPTDVFAQPEGVR